MFGKEAKKGRKNTIDSLIGVGTRVEGNIFFSGGLRIDGEVQGNIASNEGSAGMLVISEKGSVEGAIAVANVVINGTVIGPVNAKESLELLPSARVTGDVEYHQIEMQQGAVIQGRLIHQLGAKTIELKLASGN